MLVKIIMKIFKNMFGNNSKINASEIALINNNKVKKLEDMFSAITLTAANGTSLTKNNVVPFSTEYSKNGNLLTSDLTNHRVIVGAGVNYVEVSVQMQGAYDNRVWFVLRKNGTSIQPFLSYNTTDCYAPISMISKIISVEEGDYFDVYYSDGNTFKIGTGTGVADVTYMTVKVVG